MFRDGEILVQSATATDAAAKDAVSAAVQGRAMETAAMKSQGDGTLERISLGKGVTVERAI